uniref:Ig-like domain-containing protein n=1 Tax=Panagrolaimus sp. JU765 TaxID=591449 RepID=A0AC34Q2R2_9BILA
MRWILISSFLAFKLASLFVGAEIDGQLQNLQLGSTADQKLPNRIHALRRRRHNFGRNSIKYGFLTKNAISKNKPKHAHRQEKFHFVLRCPQLPPGEPAKKTQIGVEWSKNSEMYLRIMSNGKKFKNDQISTIEEWRTVSGQLNVIAYGPKAKKYRYKFEYEEARGWFALKIRNITEDDFGNWQCRIKLRLSNSTILEFESRKNLDSKEPEKPKIEIVLQEPKTEVEKEEASYSEPLLFSFSKPGGEFAVFNRVDKRRDLVAYVRADSKSNQTPKFEKRRRYSFCSDSAKSTINFLILAVFFFIS